MVVLTSSIASDFDGDLVTVLLKMPVSESKFLFSGRLNPHNKSFLDRRLHRSQFFFGGEPEVFSSSCAPQCVRAWEYWSRPEAFCLPRSALITFLLCTRSRFGRLCGKSYSFCWCNSKA